MNYRGYLIDRLTPAACDRITAQSLPWAFGLVGHGITGWARTSRDAKAAVDRDIARRERLAFEKVAAEAGLTDAIEQAFS